MELYISAVSRSSAISSLIVGVLLRPAAKRWHFLSIEISFMAFMTSVLGVPSRLILRAAHMHLCCIDSSFDRCVLSSICWSRKNSMTGAAHTDSYSGFQAWYVFVYIF